MASGNNLGRTFIFTLAAPQQFPLTVLGAGTGNGSVTGPGINCTLTHGGHPLRRLHGGFHSRHPGDADGHPTNANGGHRQSGFWRAADGGDDGGTGAGGLAAGPLEEAKGENGAAGALAHRAGIYTDGLPKWGVAWGLGVWGWTGCDTAVGTQCTVTMNADRTVTATFNLAP